MSAERSLNLLYHYYTHIRPNPVVLELCGAVAPDLPYTAERDDDLTVIVNAYARPEYLGLIWEAVQYQSRRPRETWIVQNWPGDRAAVPRELFERIRAGGHHDTRIMTLDVNLGPWFRFFLAALWCRTRYVAIYDDDTLSGRLALETALAHLERQPGVYGSRGIICTWLPDGPSFWKHEVEGWPSGTDQVTAVDFVGHLWVMETYWLRELFRHLPEPLLASADPGRQCGEDMYLSFVAQRVGLPTYVLPHGRPPDPRWSSIQGNEMGTHPNSMSMGTPLDHGDRYLTCFVRQGWRLLRYQDR